MSTDDQTRQTPLATNEVVTVDDSCSKRLMDTGVIIGRAFPHCCQDPNVRPVVRAIVTKVGAIHAYIPAKYAKRTTNKLGIQIAMSNIEYTAELDAIAYGEKRTKAIKAMMNEKLASDQSPPTPNTHLSTVSLASTVSPDIPPVTKTFEIIDASQHQRLLERGIIIGSAKEHWCRLSHQCLMVRAMLNSSNAVMAYVPAQYANHPRTGREVQIPLHDVDFAKAFAGLPPLSISGAIKEQILIKGGKSMDLEEKKNREHIE